jgi:hypothetical protein
MFLINYPLLSPLGQLAVINSLITPVTHLNSSNKYFGSKFAYYALFGLSLAYLITFTWKFFIRNK